MLAVGYRLPKVTAVAMPPPGADGEAQKKAKFDKDFIIVSEFSEQVGPIPISIVPENGSGTFDTSHFSVRIMSSDFQGTTGKFSVSLDTQVILSEKMDGAFAYVHYFCLYDIHARGYVRQFCISYVTSSMNKLTDNFEGLHRHFTEATTLLKCGNHRVFGKDLEHHLADLEHTSAVLEDEGWAGRDEADQRYAGYDFGSENVPERDPIVVRQAIDETKDIMETMKKEMSLEHNEKTQIYLEKQRKSFKQLQQRVPTDSPLMRRDGQFISYMPAGFLYPNASPDVGTGQSFSSVASDLSSSSEVTLYEPQRVMAHIVHKFERRLRPLQELSPRAYMVAMEKIKEIHQLYSRSEDALEMENEEALLLDPHSSLLTIGRVPQFNALQNHWLHISQPSPLLKPVPYLLSCKNTWGLPLDAQNSDPSMRYEVVEGPDEGCSGFDTGFLQDGSALNKWPLYLDCSTSRPLQCDQFELNSPGVGPGHMTHENGGSQESTAYNTPQALTTPERSPTPLSNGPSEREDSGHTIVEFAADPDPGFSSVKPEPGTGTRPEPGTGTRLDKRTSQPLPESQQQPTKNHAPVSNSETPAAIANGSVPPSQNVPELVLPQSPEMFSMGKAKTRSHLFSINSDRQASDDVFSSSVDGWDHAKSRKKKKRSPVRDINGSDFDESFEDSFSKVGSKKHSSPLLLARRSKKADKRSPERPGFFQGNPRGSRGKGKGQAEGDERKKGPPDLKIAGSADREGSPEFYSPVGAPPGSFSAPSMGGLGSPMSPHSLLSVDSRSRWPPLLELRGKSKIPFISSIDQIEGDYRFKPGRGILNFCKDNPNVRDLLYCLLHGRPLIIMGKDENLIRRMVRTLWLFVPGHSSRQQVILWQRTPLDTQDLSRVRLMGLHCQGSSDMLSHVRRYISYWDCNSGKLYTPQYRGELLKPILMRNKDRKNEAVFLTHIHSVISDIAMRAFIYYHGHCSSQTTLLRRPSSSEAAPRKYHTVTSEPPKKTRSTFLQLLGVKDSDVDIIEYFVEVLRDQQLLEWRADGASHGGPGRDGPVTIKLHTKLCVESYCKARKPY